MSPATDDGKTPLIIESQDGYNAVGWKLRRTIIRVSAVCLLILVVAGALCGIILATTSKPDSTTNGTTNGSTAALDTSGESDHAGFILNMSQRYTTTKRCPTETAVRE